MGEILCSDCGRQTNEYAPVCEHCGKVPQRDRNITVGASSCKAADPNQIEYLSDLELLKMIKKITPIKNSSDELLVRKEWERRNLPLVSIEKLKAQLSQLGKKDKDNAKLGPKTCPSCNKANNPSFERCWNCSAELEGKISAERVFLSPQSGHNVDLAEWHRTNPVKVSFGADVVKCQQCRATMKKTTKYEADMAAQQLGCLLALIGIFLLFFFPIGTMLGIIIIIATSGAGARHKKIWKCPSCGFFFERA